MRIIDKNTDFYDYLQNAYRDDSLTFDRRDSYIVTKETVCSRINCSGYYSWNSDRQQFMLLQVGNVFWLFLLRLTNFTEYGRPTDYEAELIATWKNFDLTRKLIELSAINFGFEYHLFNGRMDVDKIRARKDALMQAINTKNYRIEYTFNQFTVYQGTSKIEKHIPLLKASGLAPLINPMDIFFAFDEYFSLEKTASERTEAIGMTNDNKIETHGFDVKTSFRSNMKCPPRSAD